jgi:aminopeptidase 2
MEGMTLDHRQLLPTNVKPVHYSLIVKPDFTTFTYPGKVAINLDVLEESNEISLHTLDLQIQSVSLAITDSAFGMQAPSNIK